MSTRTEPINSAVTGIVVVLLTAVLLVTGSTAADAQETGYRAVIIRGAGYLPGTKPPEDPDAITHATSEPGNTYVFSERLAEELGKNGITTTIAEHTDCADMSCVTYTDAGGARRAVDFVILAGPSYMRYLPQPLQNLLPRLKEELIAHPDILCSSMISGNYTYRVVVTMVNTDMQLREIGAKTIPGLVFNSDVIQQELDEDVKDFVSKLIGAAEGK